MLLAHADASLYAMKARRHGRDNGKGELDALFEALPHPTLLWRASGDDLVLERHNRAAADASGGAIAALVGRLASELYGDDAPDILADLRHCVSSPASIQREMTYTMRATGERRDVTMVFGHVRPGLVAMQAVFAGGLQEERDGWERSVGQAIAQGRLLVYAQPIVSLRGGADQRSELLVRLRDTGGEIVGPGAFLPAAERLGLVGAIDRWMIERAFEAAAAGRTVHVNLSARSLGDRGLVDLVTDRLATTGADPGRVVFEITETAAVERLEDAVHVAGGLHELGCGIALDDFGTGYGTLTYLAALPADYVKIDMSFVHGLLSDEGAERVVRSILRTAAEFGLRTVAEGVEDGATLERLVELGVDHAQGYHLGRPAPDLTTRTPPVAR